MDSKYKPCYKIIDQTLDEARKIFEELDDSKIGDIDQWLNDVPIPSVRDRENLALMRKVVGVLLTGGKLPEEEKMRDMRFATIVETDIKDCRPKAKPMYPNPECYLKELARTV